MNEHIKHTIETATAVALATTGSHGVNLIPISVVTVHDNEIFLYDFFMNKTAENIQANATVVLTCWTGFSGVQVKATAHYQTDGSVFESAVQVMKERFPDRTLKAIIRLTPVAVFDVAPGQNGVQLVM